MPVDKTEQEVTTLVSQISRGEIKLPEIQRGYVWKPTQVARFIESLYRCYPTGSLLFWRTDETPETRAVATDSDQSKPAVPPLYMLDGQQRLTSLHRVLNDHPQAQVVFNIETEEFQNQSAATAKDPRWMKVYDVLSPGADLFEIHGRLLDAKLAIDSKEIGRRLNKLAAIPDYKFHMEVLRDFPYEEVTQIFVRVNSGGRWLKTTDLALATLSARWPGVLRKLEDEADHWAHRGYDDIDTTFLTRALTGAVLGRGLSAWSHARLVKASDEALEAGWATVQRGLRHLVPLLQNNLGATHSKLLPSMVVLLPLIVLLGERQDEHLDMETANGILYWFLVATLRNRYSGSTDTRLGQDIPATRSESPVRELFRGLGIAGTRIEVTPQALAGRSVGSPYFFLSFLVAKEAGARDWWDSVGISAAAEDSQKLEYHHIHPQATLRNHPNGYAKAEINDLANLAFISAKANRKISDRSPATYFPTLGSDELGAHLVPAVERLRDASAYREFLAARRDLLSESMTELLDRFRPRWLDETKPSPDPIAGSALEFVLYVGAAEHATIVATARAGEAIWSGMIDLRELEAAIGDAVAGLDSDLKIAGESVPVSVTSDAVEIPIGPFRVSGSTNAWRAALERERQDARPMSQLPDVPGSSWANERTPFPVADID